VAFDEAAAAAAVPDPFLRVEPVVPPLRGQFLHAALGRLEESLGAGYRGSICGAVSSDPRAPAGADMRFRLDATDSCAKPLLNQIDELFVKVRPRGAAAVLDLCQRFQMEAPPGIEKPPLEAARLLAEEGGGAQ
jgi:hypothetical protein